MNGLLLLLAVALFAFVLLLRRYRDTTKVKQDAWVSKRDLPEQLRETSEHIDGPEAGS